MSFAPFQGAPPTEPEALLVDVRTAAKMLSVSERLLWSWTKAGQIGSVHIGRRVLYPVQGLRDWVAARTHGGPAATAPAIETPSEHDLKHRPAEPPVTTPEAARRRTSEGAR